MCRICDLSARLLDIIEEETKDYSDEDLRVLFANLICGSSEDDREVVEFLGFVGAQVFEHLQIFQQIEAGRSTKH